MKRLREWRAHRKYGAMTHDRCETCGAHLRVKQRVEITEASPAAYEREIGMVGGSGMTATYCKEHTP